MKDGKLYCLDVVSNIKEPQGTLFRAEGEIGGERAAIELFRSAKVENVPGAVALPTRVFIAGVEKWTFKEEKRNGFQGIAKLHYPVGANGECELVIALYAKGEGSKYPDTIVRVIPIADLSKAMIAAGEDGLVFIGMRPEADIRKLRDAIVEEDGVKFRPSEAEIAVENYKKKREKEMAEQMAAADKKKREEARAAREARRTEISQRPRLVVYLSDGCERSGIPVTEAESEVVSDGTFVVIVSSYSEDQVGEPLYHCLIQKSKGGKISRVNIADNITIIPKKLEQKKLLKVEMVTVQIGEGEGAKFLKLPLCDKAQVADMLKQGINGGTMVVLEGSKDERGRHQLISLSDGASTTVGVCEIL